MLADICHETIKSNPDIGCHSKNKLQTGIKKKSAMCELNLMYQNLLEYLSSNVC